MGCLRESSSWKLAFLISGFHCWDPVHRQGYREAAGADAWRSFRGTNVHTISWTGRHSRWCPACCTILGESLVQFQLTVKVKKVRDYTMRQTKDWQAGPNMCFSIRVFFLFVQYPLLFLHDIDHEWKRLDLYTQANANGVKALINSQIVLFRKLQRNFSTTTSIKICYYGSLFRFHDSFHPSPSRGTWT